MTITLDGTNGISAPNVYGRNLIINGSGRINQRGYTSGTATSGANEYTLDRWRVVTSGQNLSFTGNDAGRVMTAPAGGAEQVIEGANIAGGTYVLNWTGTATATVGGASVSKGGTFTLTANTNATVRFTGGTFSEVQLEPGSVATPFEFRSYGQELALCHRYYQKGALVERHHGGSPVQYLASVRYGIPLRVSPTRTVQNNGSVDVNAATFATYGGASQLEIGVDTTSSSAYINCNWTADAEL